MRKKVGSAVLLLQIKLRKHSKSLISQQSFTLHLLYSLKWHSTPDPQTIARSRFEVLRQATTDTFCGSPSPVNVNSDTTENWSFSVRFHINNR
uniref:Secreted protein n=1 Tax=Rodentolepis nana TaxID=102285 RepID=A0A0R3THM6_RODNA